MNAHACPGVCAALLCAVPLTVSADTPADYSHALPLRVSGNNALIQLRLPPAVYLHARNAQLDDVRVFDAAGKALPFALLEPPPPSAGARTLSAAIFPVLGEGKEAPAEQIDVRTAAGATISTSSRRAGQAGQQLNALVLDFGPAAAEQAINALDFTLPSELANYEAQVALEVSDDLRNWETHAYATLSWLSNGAGQTLAAKRMEFPARAFRYGRLVWRAGTPLRFAAVHAQVPLAAADQGTLDSVTLHARPGRYTHDLVYQAAPAIAAERVGLSFGPGNVVMPVAIGEYLLLRAPRGHAGPRQEFVPRLHATFYQFVQNGAVRRSGDIAAGGMQATQWVLRTEAGAAPRPALTLSWRPATLVFLVSGRAPYALHVGHAQAKGARRPIAEVAPGLADTELRALEAALPGELQARQPATSADKNTSAALPRKLVLWGVLLLGVAMLAAMVWKLSRQMKQTEGP